MQEEIHQNKNCCQEAQCKDTLCQMVQAYYSLLSGEAVQEVTTGEDTTRYFKGDVDTLKKEIIKLHANCPTQQSMAIAGGRRRAAGVCYGESSGCGVDVKVC